MKTIVLLVGPHGSGKTSLADALDREHVAVRLRQYTTRSRRDGESDEYMFVSTTQPDVLWRYTKAGSEYGFSISELSRLSAHSVGVVAAHTEAIHRLKEKPSGANIVTVGLDTLTSHEEQLSRVNDIEGRVQTMQAFEESRNIARSQDVCLSGDFNSVLSELKRVIDQIRDTTFSPAYRERKKSNGKPATSDVPDSIHTESGQD